MKKNYMFDKYTTKNKNSETKKEYKTITNSFELCIKTNSIMEQNRKDRIYSFSFK